MDVNYQIMYEPSGGAKRLVTAQKWLKIVGFGILIMVICAVALWSLGGDWTVTVNALENMAESLQQGNALQEAFSSFCLDILKGANCG